MDGVSYKPQNLPCLLVIPAALKLTFQGMVANHSAGFTVYYVYKSDPKYCPKKASLDKKQILIITTYETLAAIYKRKHETKHTLLQVHFGLMICDEAHFVKGNKTLRNEACIAVKKNFTLLSTGTPFHNDPAQELQRYCAVMHQNVELDDVPKFVLRRNKLQKDENGNPLVDNVPVRIDKKSVVVPAHDEKIILKLIADCDRETLTYLRAEQAAVAHHAVMAMICRQQTAATHIVLALFGWRKDRGLEVQPADLTDKWNTWNPN